MAQIAKTIESNATVNLFLTGPAIQIFKEVGLDANHKNIQDVIKNSDVVITGTGWQSQTEQNAIESTLEAKKSCFVVLDHWQDFRSRFRSGLMDSNPTLQLVVTNSLAYHLAKNNLPEVSCVEIEDLYLSYMLKKYTETLEPESLIDRKQILYLSNGQPFSFEYPYGQLRNLEKLSHLFELGHLAEGLSSKQVVLRPHPADSNLDNFSNIWNFELEINSEDLVTQLCKSKIVIGADTYALYVAMKLGRPVITVLEEDQKPVWLDFAPSINLLQENTILRKIFFKLLFNKSGPTYLRPFSITDIDNLHLFNLNGAEHMRFSRISTSKVSFIDSYNYSCELKELGGYHLAIVNRDHSRIGSVTLRFEKKLKQIEIGILVYKEFLGQGFGSMAWKQLSESLNLLFPDYSLWAGTLCGNKGMIRIMKKSGFVLDSSRVEKYLAPDSIDTLLIYRYKTISKIQSVASKK